MLGVDRDLGVDAVRLTIPWKRGQSRPTRIQQIYLYRVAQVVAERERVVLAVYGRARQAPLAARDQAAYCDFVAHALARIPVFWPQSGLFASFQTTTSSMSRARPILDTFGHNVYPKSSAEPPWTRHDTESIDEGDYTRLMQVLAASFGGTAQPLPGQGRPTIWYLEDGFQTIVPPDKARRTPATRASGGRSRRSPPPPAPRRPSATRRRSSATRSSSPTASRRSARSSISS